MKALAAMLLVAAGLLGKPQDPTDLLRDLGEDDIARRESATRLLIERGEASLPALRTALESSDAEVRQRARFAIEQIDVRARLESVYRETPPFSLDFEDAPFREIQAAIASRAGIRFSRPPAGPERRITVKMERGTLLEALDRLCAALGDTSWTFEDDDCVLLQSGVPTEKPSAYSGRFRVSLRRMSLHKSVMLGEESAFLSLAMDARWEPRTSASGTPLFVITELKDDAGGVPALQPHASFPFFEIPRPPEPDPHERDGVVSGPMSFSGVSPAAKKLSLIRGRATFFFPLGTESVILDDLETADEVQVGAFTVHVGRDGGPGTVQITLISACASEKLDHYLDPQSITVTDLENHVHSPTSHDVYLYSATPNSVSYSVYFDRMGDGRAKSVTFHVNRYYEKHVPFEFRDVPLP